MVTQREKTLLKEKLLSDKEIDDIESYDETTGKVILKDGNVRRLTSIFTRCMGYFRPVENYNIGKKQEFEDRKWFTEEKACPCIHKKEAI